MFKAKRKALYKERALEILREVPLRVWLSNDLHVCGGMQGKNKKFDKLNKP